MSIVNCLKILTILFTKSRSVISYNIIDIRYIIIYISKLLIFLLKIKKGLINDYRK